MFPLQMRISRSKELKISVEGWWIVDITLTPLRLKIFKSSTTCRAVELSSPVVGSSKKSIEGLVRSSTPMDVLFLSPPETPLIKELPTFVFLHLVNPSSLINLLTLVIFYSSLSFLNLKSAINLNASVIWHKHIINLTRTKLRRFT